MNERFRPPAPARELPLPRLDESTPLPDALPVCGGWGYSKADACVITDDHEPSEGDLAHGLDFEFYFIEHRLIEELNAMPLNEELIDIRWKVVTQELHRNADCQPGHDHLKVHLSASNPDRTLRFARDCEFWFDVSRVKGIGDDAEFSMRIGRGRIRSPRDSEAPER